jgi:hypothetical protein
VAVSYLAKFRADLRRIAPAQAEDLLRALDLVLGQERREHFILGQADAAKPAALPEDPEELVARLEFLRLSGCSGVIAFGRLGIRVSIADPELMEGVHRQGESVEQVVKEAFDHWEAVRPKVEAIAPGNHLEGEGPYDSADWRTP